ncbi:MAG: protein kinase [Ramlibacter sp.]
MPKPGNTFRICVIWQHCALARVFKRITLQTRMHACDGAAPDIVSRLGNGQIDRRFMTSLQTPANASSALPNGTRLAEFEITGVLGEGGFGIVYSAHDASLDRQVAVKEYFPFAMSFRGANATVQVKAPDRAPVFAAGMASFVNEARMLASFSHPALVEVFRFWEANGTAYMVMRRYDGTTLQALLLSTPQLATEAWLRQTLDPVLLALEELHKQQCYHRDIAPDNIMVLPDGRPVLMDFGAARRIIGGMSQALTSVLKPGYAPVEQYSGDGEMHQGAWTDIYAIGALLYQAMTGQVPMQAISRMTKDLLIPVAQLARQPYSESLCQAVMKCLAVLPADRFQNIDAMRAALGWDASGSEWRPDATMYSAGPASNTTRPLSSASGSRSGPLLSPPSPGPVQPAFDPQATASRLTGVNPAVLGKFADVPAADFDPLATVVPTRPPVRRPAGQEGAVHVNPPSAPQPPPPASTSPSRVRDIALVVGLAGAAMISVGVLIYLFSDSASPPVTGSQSAANAPAPAAVAPPAAPVAPPPVVAAMPPPMVTPAPSPPTLGASPAPDAGNTPVLAPPGSAPAPRTRPAEPPAVATTGVVRFELKGGWANVFVNGEDKGITPPVLSVKLPAGTYDVELRNPALPTVKRTVTVIAGKSATLRHAFIKEQGPSPTSAKPRSTY